MTVSSITATQGGSGPGDHNDDGASSDTMCTGYRDEGAKRSDDDTTKKEKGDVKTKTEPSHDGDDEREIPIEIDDHFRLFGKEPWEVEYGEKCTECQSRIDEYGFCSCDASGD